MDATIIIPTRNRQDSIIKCLESVHRAAKIAAPHDIEVIVVDK